MGKAHANALSKVGTQFQNDAGKSKTVLIIPPITDLEQVIALQFPHLQNGDNNTFIKGALCSVIN